MARRFKTNQLQTISFFRSVPNNNTRTFSQVVPDGQAFVIEKVSYTMGFDGNSLITLLFDGAVIDGSFSDKVSDIPIELQGDGIKQFQAVLDNKALVAKTMGVAISYRTL